MLSINDELYATAQMTEFALDSWLSPVYSGDTVLAEAMRYACSVLSFTRARS